MSTNKDFGVFKKSWRGQGYFYFFIGDLIKSLGNFGLIK